MKAQELYDLQENTGFCSGSDLHSFFEDACGDPSPSGDVFIAQAAAQKFIDERLETMAANSPAAYREVRAAMEKQ